jgi:septal ring factor EnvC (AmiA/AmiB activator)
MLKDEVNKINKRKEEKDGELKEKERKLRAVEKQIAEKQQALNKLEEAQIANRNIEKGHNFNSMVLLECSQIDCSLATS